VSKVTIADFRKGDHPNSRGSAPAYHQWRLANCDWMPASYTSRLFFYDRRYPTCWASSPRSHTVTNTPCHGTWLSALLSAHLSTVSECTASQIDTHLYPPHNNLSVQLTTTKTEVQLSGRIIDLIRSGWTTPPDSALSATVGTPPQADVKNFQGEQSSYALYNMESLINEFTNHYICFYNLFNVIGLETKENYSREEW